MTPEQPCEDCVQLERALNLSLSLHSEEVFARYQALLLVADEDEETETEAAE
jgi:hypothetical protein